MTMISRKRIYSACFSFCTDSEKLLGGSNDGEQYHHTPAQTRVLLNVPQDFIQLSGPKVSKYVMREVFLKH